MVVQESVDTVIGDGVTVTARAPGAWHPECESIPDSQRLIRPGNDERRGPGRRWPKPASVAVLADRQAGPRWHVAQVDRRAVVTLGLEPWHQTLERVIGEAGFDAVVPMYRSAEDVLVAAFPGYALVEFDVRDPAWRALPQVRGVRRLIGPTDRPMAVADVQAAWVLGQFGPDGYQRRPMEAAAAAPLPRGVWVRVVLGLGLGWSGAVLESDGRSAVLDVQGRRVRVAQAALQVVGPPPG
jgi:transcription antitermination factor NusG